MVLMERHLRTAMYLMAMGLLFAASCSTRQAVPLGDKMQSWVGQPRDTLVQKWGPPDKEAPLQDGGTSLLYGQQSAVGLGAGNAIFFFARSSAGTCRMIFNLDRGGIIRSSSHYGHCRRNSGASGAPLMIVPPQDRPS